MNSLRHQRPGVCHRCGWKGTVGKLRRVDRKHLSPTGDSYGRLCAECLTDLFRAPSTVQSNPARLGPVKLSVMRDRHVA